MGLKSVGDLRPTLGAVLPVVQPVGVLAARALPGSDTDRPIRHTTPELPAEYRRM